MRKYELNKLWPAVTKNLQNGWGGMRKHTSSIDGGYGARRGRVLVHSIFAFLVMGSITPGG